MKEIIKFPDGSEIVKYEHGVAIICDKETVSITKTQAWPVFVQLSGVKIRGEWKMNKEIGNKKKFESRIRKEFSEEWRAEKVWVQI